MKKIIIILLSIVICSNLGCQRVTINDAEKIANEEDKKIAGKLSVIHSMRETKPYDSGENWLELEVDEVSGNNYQSVEIGESIDTIAAKCTVTDVKVSENLYDIKAMTDENKAKKIIEELLNSFGPDSYFAKYNGCHNIDLDGSLSGMLDKLMFIEIKLVAPHSPEICFAPTFYTKDDEGKLAYTSAIEIVELSDWQNPPPNHYYYKLSPGKEYEFIMACMVSSSSVLEKDIYMSLNFIEGKHANPQELAPGTKFIKVWSKIE